MILHMCTSGNAYDIQHSKSLYIYTSDRPINDVSNYGPPLTDIPKYMQLLINLISYVCKTRQRRQRTCQSTHGPYENSPQIIS